MTVNQQSYQRLRNEHSKGGRNLVIAAVLIFIIGYICGCIGYVLFGNLSRSVGVLVVSKEAVLAYEEQRLEEAIKQKTIRDKLKSGKELGDWSKDGSENKLSGQDKLASDDRVLEESTKMFFGKGQEALNILEQVTKELEDNNTKVVFISHSSKAARGGKEISKFVHGKIIEQLQGGSSDRE